ncbi:hypothetical protein HK105_207676 [Polyrhizophydium stewartii]|uniref:N-acetyltransferase domain-containing protein n=1 Tax=Polyrhizophydium stewartii TaxID=2732419 RepID=A0ABR4MZV5_9FUNG|nr:hypothetical protein HK105_006504 [Polyrhizophydium stewartii]
MPVARLVTTQAELDEVHRVRIEVFVEEQGYSHQIEVDDPIDPQCTHWLLLPDDLGPDEPVAGRGLGTVRLVPSDPPALGRLCVVKAGRGKGWGRILALALHDHARSLGVKRLAIHSQEYAVPFYEKLGYYITDHVPFLDEGQPHLHMAVDL